MLKINTTKPYHIFTEVLEDEALKQFEAAMQLDCVVQGALMPDAHTGYTLPIGAVVACKDMVFPAMVGYDVGCLDKDTEFLSEKGWVKISEYNGEKVLQYTPESDTANFVTPQHYIKKQSNGFYKLFQKDGMDQMLSADHKVAFWQGVRGRGYSFRKFDCVDLLSKHGSLKKGLNGGIKTTFNVENSTNVLHSDDIIRVNVMVSADGHIRKSGRVELHFRKQRKVERAENLLRLANIEYSKTVGQDETVFIYFSSKDVVTKELGQYWGCNNNQLAVIADEVLYWDGHTGNHECYFTTNKENADFVQYCFASVGVRAGIQQTSYVNEKWKPSYSVYKTKNEYVGLPKSELIEVVPSEDGFEYCFTVPSGYFVARRNNKIFITGNCGMCAVPTTFNVEDIRANAKAIFDQIYRDIPTGFSHNQKDSQWAGGNTIAHTEATEKIFAKNGLKQLGSLGSGNHFIEVGVDAEGVVWFIIHSGSRGIGHAVASHYMRVASGDGKAREGFFGFHVDAQEGKDYIQDLNFCLEFALANRVEMLQRIEKAVQRTCVGVALFEDTINRNHNHAELKDGLWIHRKGATHAEDGMLGVIPGNMRDGSFIVRGKGNPDSLFSSSHGAGRVLGRKEAQRVLAMEDFSATMSEITAKVSQDTLDESPFAYKNIFTVMEQQKSLVDVVAHVKPIINIKG